MINKRTISKRLMVPVAVAALISLILGVAMAWGVSATHGGKVSVGSEEITTVISNQGQFTADEGMKIARDIADNAKAQVIDRPGDATLVIDHVTGMLKAGTTAAATTASGAAYSVEVQPNPTVRPTIEPNNAGVDIVTPNQARIHLTGTQDTAMIIRDTVVNSASSTQRLGNNEIGVIQTSVDGTRVIAMDNAGRVASMAQYTADAVRNGTSDNTSIETCVAADGSSGDRVVIGVPQGTIGGWSSNSPNNQCPTTPVSINTQSVAGLQGLQGLPQLPGVNTSQLTGLMNLLQLPGLTGLNLPQLPGLTGLNLPQLPTSQLPQLPVGLPQVPQVQLQQLPIQLPQLPIQLPQLPVQLPIQLPL